MTFNWLKAKRTRTALILSLGLRFIIPAAAQNGPETAPKRSAVEVVFVLDTTSSMGGMIEGAKAKIWSIANEIAKGKPAPKIKMGLVAFRDKGDSYVTKDLDLSANLDAMYNELLALRAEGGGDGPENVLKGLQDAVENMSWSKDSKTFKVIYVVGDAPAHTEYKDVPSFAQLAQSALRKGVIVNTLLCGSDSSAMSQWTELARMGEGKFLAIDHNAATASVATPFDTRMAKLTAELDGSVIGYGRRKAEAARGILLAASVAGAAAPEAAADRAEFKAKGGFDGEIDLAEAVVQKKVDMKTLPKERQQEIGKVLARREVLRDEILSLSKRRADFIKTNAKPADKDSFDARLVNSIKEQAARKGIAY